MWAFAAPFSNCTTVGPISVAARLTLIATTLWVSLCAPNPFSILAHDNKAALLTNVSVGAAAPSLR
jgi:hypothetical protein